MLHNVAETLCDPDVDQVEEVIEELEEAKHENDDRAFYDQGQEIRRNLNIIVNNFID